MAAQGDNLVMHIKLSAYPLNISHYCTWILTMPGLCVGPPQCFIPVPFSRYKHSELNEADAPYKWLPFPSIVNPPAIGN